jgi:hypothetical protein
MVPGVVTLRRQVPEMATPDHRERSGVFTIGRPRLTGRLRHFFCIYDILNDRLPATYGYDAAGNRVFETDVHEFRTDLVRVHYYAVK